MSELSFTDLEPMTAEARALHAILDDDHDEAERILRGFLPGELRALQRACGELGALCADIRRDPMQGVETDDPGATSPGVTSEPPPAEGQEVADVQ